MLQVEMRGQSQHAIIPRGHILWTGGEEYISCRLWGQALGYNGMRILDPWSKERTFCCEVYVTTVVDFRCCRRRRRVEDG